MIDDELPPLLEKLAIFPLPAAQLFPRTLLPLHVFEPRYRDLTRDALDGDGLVAIPTLAPGYRSDYTGRPPVLPVCGVGRIVQSHKHADGRYDILLRGLARVRIEEELPPTVAYRQVRARRLDDGLGRLSATGAERSALLALCHRLSTVMPEGGETLRELAAQEQDPAATADVIAAALLSEPGDRQRILEELDPARRIGQLSDAVARLVAHFLAARRAAEVTPEAGGGPGSSRPN